VTELSKTVSGKDDSGIDTKSMQSFQTRASLETRFFLTKQIVVHLG
jgi:hypothetical protein